MNSGPKKNQSHCYSKRSIQYYYLNHQDKQKNPKSRSHLGYIVYSRMRLPWYHPSNIKCKYQ